MRLVASCATRVSIAKRSSAPNCSSQAEASLPSSPAMASGLLFSQIERSCANMPKRSRLNAFPAKSFMMLSEIAAPSSRNVAFLFFISPCKRRKRLFVSLPLYRSKDA